MTLPIRAKASATACNVCFSPMLRLSPSSDPINVSELLVVSSCVFPRILAGYELFWSARSALVTLSAILTRIQCVGFVNKFHVKVKYVPGIGVVMSAGVYRRLMGKILVAEGTVSSEGLNGRIPRPFVVVHSGKTTIGRSGCRLMSVPRSV